MDFTGERMIPEKNRHQLIYLEHMSRYMFAGQFVERKRVLDIACGSGYGTWYLAERNAQNVIGVDNSPEAIAYAQEHYHQSTVQYRVGDARKIPVPDGTVDVLVSFETIEHFNEHESFFKEIGRILATEGMCIISTPNHRPRTAHGKFHKKEYSLSEFETILRREFTYTEFFYQCNVIAASITAKNCFDHDPLSVVASTDLYRLHTMRPEDTLYVVGIGSNHPLPRAIKNVSTLFNDQELRMFRAQLDQCSADSVKKDQIIKGQQTELEKIQSSPGWKIASGLHKVRGKIPLLKRFRRSRISGR